MFTALILLQPAFNIFIKVLYHLKLIFIPLEVCFPSELLRLKPDGLMEVFTSCDLWASADPVTVLPANKLLVLKFKETLNQCERGEF